MLMCVSGTSWSKTIIVEKSTTHHRLALFLELTLIDYLVHALLHALIQHTVALKWTVVALSNILL